MLKLFGSFSNLVMFPFIVYRNDNTKLISTSLIHKQYKYFKDVKVGANSE